MWDRGAKYANSEVRARIPSDLEQHVYGLATTTSDRSQAGNFPEGDSGELAVAFL